MKRVGYWLSDKKRKKLRFDELVGLFRSMELELVSINPGKNLEEQGPFDVIIHKITDFYDSSEQAIKNLEAYIEEYPDMIVLDPIPSVRIVSDRTVYYKSIRELEKEEPDSPFYCPPFLIIENNDTDITAKNLMDAGVHFPVVVKPVRGHGSNQCHELNSQCARNFDEHKMSLVFNEAGLRDLQPPCIAQQFVNHGAVLYKAFVIGDKYHLVERKSIKNLSAGDNETIFFHSGDVSKMSSTSYLTKEDDKVMKRVKPPSERDLRSLINKLQSTLDMSLLGIDMIMDSESKRIAVIDVNYFPGYDGVAEFHPDLANYVLKLLSLKSGSSLQTLSNGLSTESKYTGNPR